jgi:hypothetical protein
MGNQHLIIDRLPPGEVQLISGVEPVAAVMGTVQMDPL